MRERNLETPLESAAKWKAIHHRLERPDDFSLGWLNPRTVSIGTFRRGRRCSATNAVTQSLREAGNLSIGFPTAIRLPCGVKWENLFPKTILFVAIVTNARRKTMGSELIKNLLEPGGDEKSPIVLPESRVAKAAPDLYQALKGFINPTGHTDVCMERRNYGFKDCTKPCADARKALEKATGVPVESKI